MTQVFRTTFLVAVLFALVANASEVSYVGDGQFIDHGRHRLTKRYEVILGKVSIGSGDHKGFQFRGLPHREFILGLRLNEATCKLQQAGTVISFTVRNERGAVVLHEERPLRDLVWQTTFGSECSEPFGYVRGSDVASKGSGASTCEGAPSTGCVDRGHGTYFVARKECAYQVSVDVHPAADSVASNSFALVVLQDNGAPPLQDCN